MNDYNLFVKMPKSIRFLYDKCDVQSSKIRQYYSLEMAFARLYVSLTVRQRTVKNIFNVIVHFSKSMHLINMLIYLHIWLTLQSIQHHKSTNTSIER